METKGQKCHKIWFKDAHIKCSHFAFGQSKLTSVLFKAIQDEFRFALLGQDMLEHFGMSDSASYNNIALSFLSTSEDRKLSNVSHSAQNSVKYL